MIPPAKYNKRFTLTAKPYSILTWGLTRFPHNSQNPKQNIQKERTSLTLQNHFQKTIGNEGININLSLMPIKDDQLEEKRIQVQEQDDGFRVIGLQGRKIVHLGDLTNLDRSEEGEERKEKGIWVDMKKKIRKAYRVKSNKQTIQKVVSSRQFAEDVIPSHEILLGRVYCDNEVISEGVFRSKLISQRLDNDVDTDDEQVASGIRRLQRSLQEAIQQQKIRNRQIEEQAEALKYESYFFGIQ